MGCLRNGAVSSSKINWRHSTGSVEVKTAHKLEAEELPSYHRNIDMDEVMLSHADEDPSGRQPGSFRHTPQGILHGANEAYRAEFQARRKPGMRRTSTSVGVDTHRPLRPSAEFARMNS